MVSQINTERRWAEISAISFTDDGKENGTVTIEDTSRFKVKMRVTVQSDVNQPTNFQVKRVLNRTQMILGPTQGKHSLTSDMSSFPLSDNPTIRAVEQERPPIPPVDFERASYEEEPTMAKRVIPVNKYGETNSPENPLYTQLTDGSVNIGTVNAELEVQLTHLDNNPSTGDIADSVRIGGTQHQAEVTTDKRLQVTNSLTLEQRIKEAIMCSNDVELDFTWSEIDGVRRVVEIIYSSTSVANLLGKAEASVQRVFTYQASDPFDLVKRTDTLSLVD